MLKNLKSELDKQICAPPAPRDRRPALRYQAGLMTAAAALYWFTTYPTPLAEVGVRAI